MAFFQFLNDQPYVLLFAAVALAAAVGRLRFVGFALDTTASAILVGVGLAVAGLFSLAGKPGSGMWQLTMNRK